MTNNEDYQSIWTRKIQDLWEARRHQNEYRRYLNKPDELFTEIEAAIKSTLQRHDLQEHQAEETLKKLRMNGRYDKAKNTYEQIVRAHNELLNIENQLRKSDLESKARFLLFRILTAISIALVVLGTGWVAHKFGIPIPLLRMPV